MKIYALGDLHLSFKSTPNPLDYSTFQEYKPMGEVNEAWTDHARKIYENWCRTVGPDDVVLVPGDISWAMRLPEAAADLSFLGLLPGLKICIQGNHDYWWQSISRVRAALPPGVRAIQNDHVRLGDLAICGTRGWLCPSGMYFQEEDIKIYRRELIRLENSLRSVQFPASEVIVMMHYMPTNEKHEYSGFIELFERYGVKKVVYGHLHARAYRYRLPDRAWGISFHLVSADFLGFTPKLIASTADG
ncbi:MAG: metallophosphoesterase [Desulfotomaculales bacterium]